MIIRTARRAAAGIIAAIALMTGCGGGSGSGPAMPVPGTVELSATNINTADFPALGLQRVFSSLPFVGPVAMLQAPGDDTRWFVVQRGGTVVAFPNVDTVTPDQMSQFINIPVNAAGEGGLLGMAFHPDFPDTPEVYLSYTRTGPDPVKLPLTSVISRFTSDDVGLTLNPASEEEILTLDQPFANHNGGNIAFGPDGFLYIGLGDGGSGNDPLESGQNVNTLLGAMLRIDVNALSSGKNYAIPVDNPFAADGGAPEIYAWGLRNPWRWSFDRDTDELWLGDVGQGVWEEVDVVERGKNYGWNPCEGAHILGTTNLPCTDPNFVNPIAEYHHIVGCSIAGGYVYRGTKISNLNGVYFFADLCTGIIGALRQMPAGAPHIGVVIKNDLTVVSFGESIDGEIFVVDIGGTLHKIVAATP